MKIMIQLNQAQISQIILDRLIASGWKVVGQPSFSFDKGYGQLDSGNGVSATVPAEMAEVTPLITSDNEGHIK